MIKGNASNLIDLGSMNPREAMTRVLSEFTREDLYIGMPAIVTSTKNYETRQTIDVQIVIADEWLDGKIIKQGIIKEVFVKLEGGHGFSIEVPVDEGDLVTLHYAHRSLQKYLDGTGGLVEQPIQYAAQLNDCYATLGFGTRKSNYKPSKDNFRIRGPKTSITITQEGQVDIETEGDINTTTKANINVHSEGNTVVQVDGSATVTASGGLTVNADSTFNGNTVFNGNTTTSGTVTSATSVTAPSVIGSTSVTAAGKEMNNHIHPLDIPNGVTLPNS